ncbi:MAG: minor capsid protein [Clostridium sp.]
MESGVSGIDEKEVTKIVEPQVELLNVVMSILEKNCGLKQKKISLKELEAKGGIYAELGTGFEETRYFNKTAIKTMPILFMCRDKSQLDCLGQLSHICNYLRSLQEYPDGDTFSWIDTAVAKEPSKIGRDEDGTYHYSCIINCKIYY